MKLGPGYSFCAACNTHFVPGCGEEDWHARCPHECSMCGMTITGRVDCCPGHYMDEWRAHYEKLKERSRRLHD